MMRYEANDQLGQTTRLVVLAGTAEFNQSLGSIDNLRPSIQQALQDQGFIVAAVRVSKSGITRFSTINIELELMVYDNYSAEDARQSATQTIANATRWWLGGYYNYLTNVAFRVVQDYQTVIQAAPYNNGNSQNNPIENMVNSLAPSNLFGSAGTPVLLVAAVLAGIIIFKR